MITESLLGTAVANPEETRRWLDKADAEDSLLDFIRLMWPILEPGREFVEGWAVRAICEHLEAVTNGQIRRLLINVPPGCTKSLTTSAFFPAWEWGPRNLPATRYVCASYAQDLTVRDNRRCRALVSSPLYQSLWGDRFSLTDDQNAKVRFDTDKTGFKIATSVGGVGTGERGDRFIVDDPHNVKDAESDLKRNGALQWFSEVVPTRVNEESSAIIVIMQRVHEDDVSGQIIANDLGYEHLMLPMEFEPKRKCFTSIGFEDPRTEEGELLWPERFSREFLEKDLKPGLRAWGGEYACTPKEAPVLMADLSLKPISEVVAGDTLVGFERPPVKDGARDSRNHLVRCAVLDVYSRVASVVKVTLDSGEVIRCTPDHKWFARAVGERENRYTSAVVGNKLKRVCPPRLEELTLEEHRMGGWLGGFFDGDGSISSCEKRGQPGFRPSSQIKFYQGAGRNKPNCEKLERILDHFGLEYTIWVDDRKDFKDGTDFEFRSYMIRSNPALATFQKFLHVAQPTKWVDRLLDGALGCKFSMGTERVVSIESDGEERVYSLKTTTGNYVVWGLMSSNCSGQLQQAPTPRGGGMFQRDDFSYVDRVPGTARRVRGWDLAASKDGHAAFTVGLLMAQIPGGGLVIEDVVRGQWSPHEVETAIKECAARDGPGVEISIPQDPGSAGMVVAQRMVSLVPGHLAYYSVESGSKDDRAKPFAAQCEAGLVSLFRGSWNADFLKEVCSFPVAKLKDQVDAASRAYARLIMVKPRQIGHGGKVMDGS